MTFNPATSPRESKPHGSGERGGIAGRVEAAAKMHAPAPKGRGLVLMILGVIVLGALIWDFTGHGAARRAVGRSAGDGKVPVAPSRPAGDAEEPGPAPASASGPLQLEIKLGNATLSLSAADAVARFAALAGEDREAFRVQVLEALIKPAGRKGAQGAEAFETAARFAGEAGPDGQKALLQLKLRAWVALSDDARAPAAILFLIQLPNAGGAQTMTALDEVILDESRPLRVRIDAARARDDTNRPAELEALAENPATHPSLRDALTR